MTDPIEAAIKFLVQSVKLRFQITGFNFFMQTFMKNNKKTPNIAVQEWT
jgi:hypothetical protein